MLSQRLANIVFAILLLIACGYFAAVAQGFRAAGLLAATSGLPSRFFPQLTLGVTALCAVIVLINYVRLGAAGGDAGKMVFEGIGEARRGILMLAVSIICYVIWQQLGFIPMAVLMGPLSLLAMGVRKITTYLTVWILTALIYGIFTQLLGIQFT